jgi:type I restriction enzyme S subunit
MNADILLAYYERIAEAPDVIVRLRRFVLDLAMRGKLVLQDSRDEPASELLKRIRTEKARSAGKSARGRRPEGRPCRDDFEFVLPPGWAVSTLGEVALKITDGTHQTPVYVASGIPFVSVKDFSGGKLELSNTRFITEEEHRRLYQRCDPRRGDVLIGRIGTLGRAVLVDTDQEFSLFVSVGLIRFSHANIAPEFFRCLLNSPLVEAEFDRIKIGGGTHTNKLNLGDLQTVALPIPPLAEQHRIVAKVAELMALCDELEAARTAREATRDRLTTASLARLNIPNPETFPSDARFALDALPALTRRPDQIKQLRQTVLDLAVRGRLSATGVWWELPKKLREVASLQNGYAFKSEWFAETGARLLRNANVGHGVLDWAEEVRLPDERALEFERFRLHEGDVVLSLDRPFIASGTKVARVRDVDLPALLLQRVGRFVLSPEIEADYVFLWLRSPHFNAQVDPGRSNGVPHISSKQVEAAEIYVPPITEQHRLVSKVDELMALCDTLEASLTAATAARTRLLEATLREALQPAEMPVLEAAE